MQSGKLVAAEQLYRQIIEENPDSVGAWLGLADVLQDPEEKLAAYKRVLALDKENEQAQLGLEQMHGGGTDKDAPSTREIGEDQEPVKQAAARTKATAAVLEEENVGQVKQATPTVQPHDHTAFESGEVILTCYRHPNRTTSLRCYKCDKPICSECAVKTPVGYLCPDCQREAEDAFFNSKPMDYLLALLVALPVSLLAGWLVVRLSGSFFMILLFIFAGGAVGGFIARLAKRVIGNRRGRYIPYLISASIIVGVVFWAWPLLFALFAGAGAIFKLAGIGIYLFTAASSAFYWAR